MFENLLYSVFGFETKSTPDSLAVMLYIERKISN